MKLTAYDRPLDALARPLPGGWPALRRNAQQNHASPTTTTEGYRYADNDRATLAVQPAAAGARDCPRLATWGTGHGPVDVRLMTADHWRPDHA